LPPNADNSRLTFARWLTDRNSSTTARVFANRIWQAYFGIGIVETAEDFGTQSAAPSHPQLLDWLACEFMQPEVTQLQGYKVTSGGSGRTGGEEPTGVTHVTNVTQPWSIKHLHRLIVNSATYRQSSRVTPVLYEKDKYNRLLARGPRFRVEGEIVRDIALASSGLLNPALGGPSVFSPSPSFLYQPPASYGPKTWNDATGSDRYRRGLYTFRFRSVAYPMLQNFDAPNGDFSCVRRSRSNTPLQALTTLNEIVFTECAQALALRTLEAGGKSNDERVAYAFRRVLSRPPTPVEKADLLGLLQRQKQRIADGWVNAVELGSSTNAPPAKLPKDTTPTTLAAYTAVSRVLLNLDETITKE